MKWLLVIVIVLASGSLFYRMYHHDITAREGFVAASEKFDQVPREGALRELDAKANVKISSLIKHDRELLSGMREIADTAAQEFNNPNNRALTIKRKAAYAFSHSRRNSVIAMIICASRSASLEGYVTGRSLFGYFFLARR